MCVLDVLFFLGCAVSFWFYFLRDDISRPKRKSAAFHDRETAKICQQVRAHYESGSTRPLVIKRDAGDTHSTRSMAYKSECTLIDISSLDAILEIDTDRQVAVVEPLVTFQQLAHETLKYGFLPCVIPELCTITVGGAIQGIGIESTSWRYGTVDDICEDFDVVLGDGTLLRVNRHGPHKDLFYGLPGTYGSIALLTRATVRLFPARPYVRLAFVRLSTPDDIVEFVKFLSAESADDSLRSISFVDGVELSNGEVVFMVGALDSTFPSGRQLYIPQHWHGLFFQHIEDVVRRPRGNDVDRASPIRTALGPRFGEKVVYEEWMRTEDYCFRYDRGAFWLVPKRILCSRPKMTALSLAGQLSTRALYHRAAKTFTPEQREQRALISDVDIPLDGVKELIEFVHTRIGVFPLWFCPTRVREENTLRIFAGCSEVATKEHKMVLNVGIYGVPRVPNFDNFVVNRELETLVTKLGGVKGLYSHIYYTREEFWKCFPRKEAYDALRKKYKAEGAFMEIYDKLSKSSVISSKSK